MLILVFCHSDAIEVTHSFSAIYSIQLARRKKPGLLEPEFTLLGHIAEEKVYEFGIAEAGDFDLGEEIQEAVCERHTKYLSF